MAESQRKIRAPQARGEARRRKLLDAAIELLDERSLSDISLSDVAERADVPLGSIYHHYRNINELFGQVLVTFRDLLAEEIRKPYQLDAEQQWSSIIAEAIDRIAAMSRQHRAYVQVALNRHAPVEVRYESGPKGGWAFVDIFNDVLSHHFELPASPQLDRAILNFVDMIDALFVRSVEEVGAIDDPTIAEAKRAALVYLRLYLPEYLPRAVDSATQIHEETA